jgi:hypothetical protein
MKYLNEANDLVTMSQALRAAQYTIMDLPALVTVHGFPLPVVQLSGAVPLYKLADIEAWVSHRQRILNYRMC